MRCKLLAMLAAVMMCVVAGPLTAANILTNGDFEIVSVNRSSIFGTDTHPWLFTNSTNLPFDNVQQTVAGWETAGYNFLFRPGDADTVGGHTYYPSNLQLWGSNNGGLNTIAPSPVGGNYVAADGAFRNAPIYQELTGLTVGGVYKLSFWWAAAQQFGFGGDTTENWQICFGTCDFTFSGPDDGYATFLNGEVQATATVFNPEFGFVPWQFEEMWFTATSSTQKLSLLAYGTPLGQPPFSLIDGLSMESVPEPSTWAMMLIGFGLIGSVMRSRRRTLGVRRPLDAQIV